MQIELSILGINVQKAIKNIYPIIIYEKTTSNSKLRKNICPIIIKGSLEEGLIKYE